MSKRGPIVLAQLYALPLITAGITGGVDMAGKAWKSGLNPNENFFGPLVVLLGLIYLAIAVTAAVFGQRLFTRPEKILFYLAIPAEIVSYLWLAGVTYGHCGSAADIQTVQRPGVYISIFIILAATILINMEAAVQCTPVTSGGKQI